MFISYKYLCSTDNTQFVCERSVLPSSEDRQPPILQCVQLYEKWCSGSGTVREIYRILDGTRCVNDCICILCLWFRAS